MTRPIDADKTRQTFATTSLAHGSAIFTTKAIYNIIDHQPTVEAIPIEWIKEWMDKQNSWNLDGVVSLLRDWAERNEE